jgi:hypothetical protein
MLKGRDDTGNRKASAMLLANGALFQLSAGRGHNEGGYVKALTVRLPHVFRDAATGVNGLLIFQYYA